MPLFAELPEGKTVGYEMKDTHYKKLYIKKPGPSGMVPFNTLSEIDNTILP